MPTASVNGTQLYYIQTGQGPDTLFVHGLASNLAFWYSGIILPLRSQYQVTAYDLRGHGYSSMPSQGYTHSDMADDLLKLADHLKLGRFHLIGHSFGGLVSLSFAIRQPDRLLSLTLADAPLDGAITKNNDRAWPAWWPKLLSKLREVNVEIDADDPYPEIQVLESLAHTRVRNFIQESMSLPIFMPYGWGKGSKRTAKRWIELLDKTSAKLDIRARKFSTEDLRNIRLPTLAIYGTESRWKYSAEFLGKYIPQIDIVYVENAGHFHPWERPDFLIHSWQKFIAAIDQSLVSVPEDRRRHARCNLRLPLELIKHPSVFARAVSVNLSNQGLLMESASEFGVGAEVEISTKLNSYGQRINLKGIVIRKDIENNTRFGVELLPGEDLEIWHNYVSAP
jgi:pimeloyl-ACP methyl ester carboxylesterase